MRLRFANHLAGAVLDRFGQELILVPDGDEHFIISVSAAVSPQFFAWVFGFGREAELLSPPDVREMYAEQAADIAEQYR